MCRWLHSTHIAQITLPRYATTQDFADGRLHAGSHSSVRHCPPFTECARATRSVGRSVGDCWRHALVFFSLHYFVSLNSCVVAVYQVFGASPLKFVLGFSCACIVFWVYGVVLILASVLYVDLVRRSGWQKVKKQSEYFSASQTRSVLARSLVF